MSYNDVMYNGGNNDNFMKRYLIARVANPLYNPHKQRRRRDATVDTDGIIRMLVGNDTKCMQVNLATEPCNGPLLSATPYR